MKQVLTLLGLAIMVMSCAGAQEARPAGETKLTLGGVWVMQYRVAAGGMSPEQRLDRLQERVVQVLSRADLGPESVRVVPGRGGKSAVIQIGPLTLVTVTLADAQASLS